MAINRLKRTMERLPEEYRGSLQDQINKLEEMLDQ